VAIEGLSGTGTDSDPEHARLLALVEGVERYASFRYRKGQVILASARELGDQAVDLDRFPACSSTELAHPHCPLRKPSKQEPIRWIGGLCLRDGRVVFLLAVVVYTGAGFIGGAERIAHPITTGCAAHFSYEQALLSGLCEVVERDAVSVTWLQRLALPRIDIDRIAPVLEPSWDRYLQSSPEVEYLFFDATTDLGISIVYCLQVARSNKRLHTIVSCSADLDPDRALAKSIRDIASLRIALTRADPPPSDPDRFFRILDGAVYMATEERFHAFDFLAGSTRRRALSEMARHPAEDAAASVRRIVKSLLDKGHEVYVVDLSTDESIRVGIKVVRVVIPSLQPLSFHARAKYLGHPRLYEFPHRMGYPVYAESDLNPHPQPFG
jgi:ribosomal protein S12 methylthiotransferase accessory factor